MEFGVCRWMVDSVQIVLFGVACGVGTDAVGQGARLPITLRTAEQVKRVLRFCRPNQAVATHFAQYM